MAHFKEASPARNAASPPGNLPKMPTCAGGFGCGFVWVRVRVRVGVRVRVRGEG